MRAFRIADRRYPIFSGEGARRKGGRWNSPGRPVIYCARTYAGALLEALLHGNLGRIPRTHAAVEITIPDGIPVETVGMDTIKGWDAEDPVASRDFGDRWFDERRTAVLRVPNVVTQGREQNVLLNPEHDEFQRITPSEPQEVVWDERLFRSG